MESKASRIIPSGIEPVDKLMGGVVSGQSYLVHGDAAGKSLFGIKFLIEGLKRGENAALVIRYSPEDAIRRFARLGYDCLEDVYSGRLVILEYSNEIINQIARLDELAPVLRELEWLLGETRPQRLIFDPVAHLVVGEAGNLESRVREFAAWANSFGGTVLFIANGESDDVVQTFKPLVHESFKFEVKEIRERAIRFLVFEKSIAIEDQPIEVDPSRGVFLLGRAQEQAEPEAVVEIEAIPANGFDMEAGQENEFNTTEIPVLSESADASEAEQAQAGDQLGGDSDEFQLDEEIEKELLEVERKSADAEMNLWPIADEAPPSVEDSSRAPVWQLHDLDNPLVGPEVQADDKDSASIDAGPSDEQPTLEPASQADEIKAADDPSKGRQMDMLSDLLDDLVGSASPLDLDELEASPADPAEQETPEPSLPSEGESVSTASSPTSSPAIGEAEEAPIAQEEPSDEPARPSVSTRDIDPVITARAVEIMLRPPEISTEDLPPPAAPVEPSATAVESNERADSLTSVNPKEFNVLIIDDDPASCDAVAHTLHEYTVEIVHDGMSGLAKLISFKPDLVILDIDLPIIDGFKVLAHIRSSLNMPIIVVSGSHMRASDRVLSAELGADYYMTKPFSFKELRQKARQLIARYRGISSWIITGPAGQEKQAAAAPEQSVPEQTETERVEHDTPRPGAVAGVPVGSESDQFTPYDNFAARVEKSVKAALDNATSFSIIGCRLPNMTEGGGRAAIKLFELVRSLVRESDMISTNPRNDLVILLADADATGARAFVARLHDRVLLEMNQELSVWMRSFPDLEEATESERSGHKKGNGGEINRRASDKQSRPDEKQDPRKSYIDFLEDRI